MDKKEITKLLEKEVGLFKEIEEENSEGELYITEIQFKSIEEVLREIAVIREMEKEQVKRLREAIEGERRFIVLKDIKENISDKIIIRW